MMMLGVNVTGKARYHNFYLEASFPMGPYSHRVPSNKPLNTGIKEATKSTRKGSVMITPFRGPPLFFQERSF